MRPLKLEIHNLFSIKAATLDLDRRGVLLVTGFSNDDGDSNGSGKSSLTTNSFSWVCWGTIPSSEGVLAADIVNKKNKDKIAWAKLQVIGVDGSPYLIHRQRNPNLLRLSVYTDDKWNDISMRESKETQELINRILGKNFKTFLQTSFFGQGRNMSYMTLTPQERKAILESLIPDAPVQELVDRTKKHLGDIAGVLASHSHSLMRAEIRAEELYKRLQQAKDLLDEHIVSSKDYEKKLAEEYEAAVDTTELISHIATMEEDLAAKDSKITTLREEVFKSHIDRSNLKRVIDQLDYQRASSTCSECGRQYDIDLVKLGEDRLKTAQLLWATNDYNEQLQASLDSLSAERKKLHEDILHAKGALEEALLKPSKETLRVMLDNLHADTTKLVEEKKSLEKEYAIAYEEYSSISMKVEKLKKEENILAFWSNAFAKDIRTVFLSSICPLLEARTSYHLSKLDNPQIKVEFSTIKYLSSGEVKEEFSVRAMSDNGSSTFGLLSGGEKQLVNFAIGLALADIAELNSSSRDSILILDEPFVQLGPRNCQAIVDYLTELQKIKETILLISNETTLQSLVPNQIRVEKTNGISSIV